MISIADLILAGIRVWDPNRIDTQGYGFGWGTGNGNGLGNGDGSGFGSGYGYSNGSGYGQGSGQGSGWVDGHSSLKPEPSELRWSE